MEKIKKGLKKEDVKKEQVHLYCKCINENKKLLENKNVFNKKSFN